MPDRAVGHHLADPQPGAPSFSPWLSGLLLTRCAALPSFYGRVGPELFRASDVRPPRAGDAGAHPAELREVTAYFLKGQRDCAAGRARCRRRHRSSRALTARQVAAGAGYETLAKTTDCFDGSTARVKTLLSSKWFGKTGSTGIFHRLHRREQYQLRPSRPPFPSPMCHEIGHRMTFARENRQICRLPRLRRRARCPLAYSRLLRAFLYCYNALRKGRCRCGKRGLGGACGELRADCAAANSHYKKWKTRGYSRSPDKIYNSYLQTVGVESGRQSTVVVDLLTAWYFSQEATQ